MQHGSRKPSAGMPGGKGGGHACVHARMHAALVEGGVKKKRSPFLCRAPHVGPPSGDGAANHPPTHTSAQRTPCTSAVSITTHSPPPPTHACPACPL
eukprot:363264-Chlamydomonas_euryale.AAC.5